MQECNITTNGLSLNPGTYLHNTADNIKYIFTKIVRINLVK